MAFTPSGSVVEEKENVKVLPLFLQLFAIEVFFRIPQESMFSQVLVIMLSEKILRIFRFLMVWFRRVFGLKIKFREFRTKFEVRCI